MGHAARSKYTISGDALRAWVGEPAALPRIQHEAIVKLLAADLSDDATVLRSLEANAGGPSRRLGAARRG